MADTGITIAVHNNGTAKLEVCLEPTGDSVELAAGESCDLDPTSGRVEIHAKATFIVAGALPSAAGRPPIVLASEDDLRAYFLARGDTIFRTNGGCDLFRMSRGQMQAFGIIWEGASGVVELHAGLASIAPADRENEMTLAVARVNARAQVPGFRILPPSTGSVRFTFSTYVYLDAHGRVAVAALERAIAVSLAQIHRLAPELERMVGPVLRARSVEEEHLYFELHPCACGAPIDARNLAHELFLEDRDNISVFTGPCPACNLAHRFEFRVPPFAPFPPVIGGDDVSSLIDPGEFYWLAEARFRREDHAGGIACLQEVMKFIPAGAHAVPSSSFRTARGAALRLEEPSRFSRDELEQRIRRAKAQRPLTIDDLHTECPACSDEAYWQGEIEQREDGLWGVVVCPYGHGAFPVKKPDWQPLLKSHIEAGLARRPFIAAEYTAPASFLDALQTWADRDYADIIAERHGPLDGFVEVSRFSRAGVSWVEVQSTSERFALALELRPRGIGQIRALPPERAWELARQRDVKQTTPRIECPKPPPEPLPDDY